MEKSAQIIPHPKHYWAIYRRDGSSNVIVFSGTYSQCWAELMRKFAPYTVRQLDEKGIKIARKS